MITFVQKHEYFIISNKMLHYALLLNSQQNYIF